ncbi:DNA polymerase III subunit gamma/tau [Hydrogenophaga sp. IBVHS2]|uniref:DNA polymerase III subunit gamma/tau n=1 Tax=Hydrogenophaga sp. IBVHS2 TaxID=1985170 RepID=UPI000A2DA3FE|nr:DNA polymerase III subunit gamma/tau [Hydrogenophaga sp. IBVHS2]OSZ65996.1 DNA polymerase III, subunit gamma and tau [Hydrogenophaga sp. IBVHS2]
MSYVVLARKYRPRSFAEMVGQGHVVQALTNALTTGRLHHAYLFTGTRGVGKTTVSRILAKSLNCLGADGQGGVTAEPCGVCQACTDIDAGRFVDYTELDAASNRGVDEVQGLLEQAVYKPVQGRFKVFMIDEVHMLTNTAFNAMLKTLEEPPEYLKFVLATTDPQKVPVTVLSRCLQFNLRPMAPETVASHLQQVLQAESVAADAGALRLLARAARGSMRDALSLTDQAIAFGGGSLQEAGVRQMLGAVDSAPVLGLIDALARADGAAVVDTVNALRTQGLSAAGTLEDMTAVLQRTAVLQAVPDAPPSDDPDAPEVARLAGLLPPDETHLLYSLCLHGRTELGLAPDEYAALTMILLRLLAFKPSGTAEKKSLKTPEAVVPAALPVQPAGAPARSPSPAPSPAPAPISAPVSAPADKEPPPDDAPWPEPDDDGPPWEPDLPVTRAADPAPLRTAPPPAEASRPPLMRIPVRDPGEPGRLDQPRAAAPEAALQPTPEGDAWFEVVMQLVRTEAITALVRELALQSQLVARDEGQWLLRVERESLNQGNTRERLATALQAAGHAVRLSVEIGPVVDAPARRLAAQARERQQQAEAQIMADPFVQAMMRDFGGRIVPGSIKAVDSSGR